MTGVAVKRSKKESPLFSSGRIFMCFVSPRASAYIAITEHMPTNTTARSTDIAELSHNDSASNQES